LLFASPLGVPRILPAICLLTGLVLGLGASAQEKAKEEFAKLPELKAYRLPQDDYLIFNARIGPSNADLVKRLRMVPVIHPEGTPTTLFIDKYLHRKSQAVQTEDCYIESDWITQPDLATLASVVKHVSLVTRELVKNTKRDSVKLVLVKTKEDYLALTDSWASSEVIKKQARITGSIFLEDIRCGYRENMFDTLTLASADSVKAHLAPYLWHQEILAEGLHVYITTFMGLGCERYITLGVTTPTASREAAVQLLTEMAREFLSRPKRETLETILKSELNAITPERRSVAFTLIHYILETKHTQWPDFLSILERESTTNGSLKGPEGRWMALLAALKEGVGLSLSDLEKELQVFASKHYLYTEEVARLLGIDRECADSVFQGFVGICELKRQNKPVSAKGDKIYQDILGKMEKKLQASAEKF